MDNVKDFKSIRIESITEKTVKINKEIVEMKKDFEQVLSNLLEGLNTLDQSIYKNQTTIEQSIPMAAEKLSQNAINSIKLNLTNELQLGMDELKTNISEYGNELRHFKQSVRETSYISRNSIALICGSSFLGAALTAAAIYSWSWYNLGDENLYNLRVGAHVQSILKPLPPEVRNGFWERFQKLGQPQK